MSVSPENYVTLEEVENSYEFKLLKKILKHEYPWIMDVRVSDNGEKLNEYNLIFLDLIINPYKLSELMGWDLEGWVDWNLNRQDFTTSFLSTPFKDVTYHDAQDIDNDVNKTMRSIRKSPALPQELKFHKPNREWSVSLYVLPSHEKLPPPQPDTTTDLE